MPSPEREIKRFGWIPDHPGAGKDHPYRLRAAPHVVFPKATSNKVVALPGMVDQLDIGSCTANMGERLFNYERMRQGLPEIPLSRLALYYWTRKREKTESIDSGATITDTFWVMRNAGLAPEADWPYDTSRLAEQPSSKEVIDALQNRVLECQRLDNRDLTQIKDSLFAGVCFGFGFVVQQSFMKIGDNGLMPMPWMQENILGGHAVWALDYDDDISHPSWAKPGAVLCVNSWGEGWGGKVETTTKAQRGYFWMPYEFITNTNYADDFWSMELVTPKP